jgi:hypothetical protein
MRKVTSDELLTQQAMAEKIRTYLSYFSTFSPPELRHLYRGIGFCMPLSAVSSDNFDTFHNLLNIIVMLWSQPVLQVVRQVAVARSEIRAVRRVVQQLPVGMLQHCSNVSSRMRTRIVQHSTTFILNRPMQFFVFRNALMTLLWSVVAWIPPSALLYCYRKQLPSAFWQTFV